MRKREEKGKERCELTFSNYKKKCRISGSFALTLQYLHKLAFSLIVHAAQCCLLCFALMIL